MKLRINILLISLFFVSSISAQNFKFAAMSDSRGSYDGVNKPILSKFITDIVENHKDVKFVVFPGDLVDGNWKNPTTTKKELLNWKSIMKPAYESKNMIGEKVYVTVGNHEIQHRDDEKNFREIFNYLPQNGPVDELGTTYSFDYQDVHFTFINTDRWYYGDPQDTTDDRPDWHKIKCLDWLENDLASARKNGAKKIIVAGHEMPFPTGGHLRDGLPNLGKNFKLPLNEKQKKSLAERDKFWNILKKYDVAAYICGHEHLYSRLSVDGVYQMLVGSSGAPVYYHNSKYGDNPEKRRKGQEMKYDDALDYYKALNYNYEKGGNAQVSEDFVGIRAFNYSIFDVTPDKINVKTYGIKIKENSYSEMISGKIEIIDEFVINK